MRDVARYLDPRADGGRDARGFAPGQRPISRVRNGAAFDIEPSARAAFRLLNATPIAAWSRETICSVHRRLLAHASVFGGILRDGSAFIRRDGEIKSEFPPGNQARLLLDTALHQFKELVACGDADMSPIAAASDLVFSLLHAHAFLDGNGRVARLFGTWVLTRAGYRQTFNLRSYCHANIERHFRAVSERERTGKCDEWRSFFSSMVTHCFE